MADKKHAFLQLSDIVDEYQEKRLSFDLDGLQDLRERISLLLFYLSDDISRAISQQEGADFDRKRNYAERFDFWKGERDDNDKNYTVAVAEAKARIDNEKFEKKYVEATRKQQRVRIILSSTNHILNAIASRISNIK